MGRWGWMEPASSWTWYACAKMDSMGAGGPQVLCKLTPATSAPHAAKAVSDHPTQARPNPRMQPTGRIEPELRSGTDRRWRSVERRIVWARSLKLAADAHFVRQQPTKGVRSSALEHDLIPP